MKVAIYGRVSTKTKGQDSENQLIQLREYCKRMEYDIYKEYIDEESGGNPNREKFQQLFTDAKKRKYDLLLFWSLDRFSREGVRKTIFYLQDLEDCGITFKSFTEQYLDSTGLFKDAIIALLACLARQEKVRLSERVVAGLQKARLANRVGGRRRIDENLQNQVIVLKKDKCSNREIARRLHISPSTVGQYVN